MAEHKNIYKTYRRFPVAFVSGKGVRLTDDTGKEYIDLISGIGVNILGHSHNLIRNTIADQAGQLLHTSNLYRVIPQEKVAAQIASIIRGAKCFFCNSGTEANEAALKLALKYGQTAGKKRLLAMEKSFHGRTLGSLSLTGQEKYRKPFGNVGPKVDFVPFNDRAAFNKAAKADVAAVFLEVVQGEGGVNPADPAFLEAVSAFCAKNNALLIIDEVQTGIGRTGEVFAYQHFGLKPDVVTMAKGLGAGLPIGCMAAVGQAAGILEPGDHAATFGGNHLVTRVAGVVLDMVAKPAFLKEVTAKGELFRERLEMMRDKFQVLGRIKQLGLMIGVELDGDVSKVVKKALEKGVLINAAGGDTLRFLPPLIISELEIESGLNAVELALKESFS